MATLGAQVSELVDQQNALQETCVDPKERGRIRARIEELGEQLEGLIDTSWDVEAAQYQEVCKEIAGAAASVNKARKGLQEIDAALKLVDAAIQAIAGLIKAA